MTEFELRWHTNKYEDVVTAIEVLDPSIFRTDFKADLMRAQIASIQHLLLQHVIDNHCEKDKDE